MAYPSMLPDAEGLARLIRSHRRDTCPIYRCNGKKHTYVEIARAFGVSKGAVYQAMRRAGLTAEGSRVDHTTTIPWTLRPAHRYEMPAEILRLLGRAQRGDDEIPQVKYDMMVRWITDLVARGEVVDYSPEKGWQFVQRAPGDADVIRPPDDAPPEVYTHPDDQEVWGMTEFTPAERRVKIARLQRRRGEVSSIEVIQRTQLDLAQDS